MRILHTSDWHLGHSLHGLSRDFEHRRFLAWLLQTLEQERIDVLLVCGDIFDTANPSAHAQRTLYDFLTKAHTAMPGLQIVVVGGNHDSAQRLEAPRGLVETLGFHLVGDCRLPDGSLDMEQMIVPLRERGGAVGAWCAAVPFLRPADLVMDSEAGDPLIAGVERLYAEVLAAAREKRQPGQALFALGHCYMVGTELSEMSERKVLGGNQHALPVAMFPGDVGYVALGHLHKAQIVGGRENVRYCGSPIPLSMAEGRNRQQVLRVDLDAGKVCEIRSLDVPRAVDIVRLPATGPEPIEVVLAQLEALPDVVDLPDPDTRPFLEVRVMLDRPIPDLRAQVEAALESRAARLVRIATAHPHTTTALADQPQSSTLQDLQAEDVFAQLYQSRHGEAVPTELLHAFHELVDDVHQARQGKP